MFYINSLSGNTTPRHEKYQIGAAMANVGVPVVVGGSNSEGVELGDTTTGSVDLVGITTDTQASLVTAQQSDNSDTARLVTVCVDPNACYWSRLSGGATEGTALAAHTVDTVNSAGTSIETDTAAVDETVIFCWKGSNVGIGRKVTAVSGNHSTVTVAFPHDTVVGDIFMVVPLVASPYGMEDQFPQLTTNLYEVDASAAVDTNNNNFRAVELRLLDHNYDSTRTESGVVLTPFDSIFAAGGSV